MLITKTSQLSGKKNTMNIEISEEDLQRVDNRIYTGELIQNIIPSIPKEEREFLISGTTPAEWEELMW